MGCFPCVPPYLSRVSSLTRLLFWENAIRKNNVKTTTYVIFLAVDRLRIGRCFKWP